MTANVCTFVKEWNVGDPVIQKGLSSWQQKELAEQLKSVGSFHVNGNSFRPCGVSTSTLPAGFYDVLTDDSGLFFSTKKLGSEEITIFDSNNMSKVLDVVNQFWSQADVFRNAKLRHKIGILLYGIPGTGKTSLVNLLARNIINSGGYALALSNILLFPYAYEALRRFEPKKPILIAVEDLDGFDEEQTQKLLNIIDGLEDLNNIIFVSTTNYLDNIQPRMLRPCRFEHLIEIVPLDYKGRYLYLTNLCNKCNVPIDKARLVKMCTDTDGMPIVYLRDLFTSSYILELPYDEILVRLLDLHKRNLAESESSI